MTSPLPSMAVSLKGIMIYDYLCFVCPCVRACVCVCVRGVLLLVCVCVCMHVHEGYYLCGVCMHGRVYFCLYFVLCMYLYVISLCS